jgi:predicted metal-dependent phosphoesterase TrpH
MNKIDLHMHTTISNDGTYSPETIIQMCHEAGLEIIALADHNSTKAFRIAKPIADAYGMKLIPAVELDCQIETINLHVLGYGINPNHPAFDAYEEEILTQERNSSQFVVNKIRELGIHLEDEALNRVQIHGVITGEMIAEVALEDSKNDNNELLVPYREGGSRSQNPLVNFYWDYCAQGKVAYYPIKFRTIDEIIQMIKDAGGFAVLAHPGNNIKTNVDVFKKIIDKGVIGVEVYSSYHSPEVIEHYHALALEHDLIMTLGSDFHGKTKPSIHLGKFNIPDEKQLTERFIAQIK